MLCHTTTGHNTMQHTQTHCTFTIVVVVLVVTWNDVVEFTKAIHYSLKTTIQLYLLIE